MSDYSVESWKSAAFEQSSSDGPNHPRRSSEGNKNTSPHNSANNSREYHQHVPPKDFGSKSPSPQNSMSSEEFIHAMRGEKQNMRKYSTPLDSANASYNNITFGSNYSSAGNSGPSETDFGNMTPPQYGQADIKMSSILQSMNNLNLEIRTKGSPPFSMSESSDLSEVLSFPSDVSFEIMDAPRGSDSSRSSTSSQAAGKSLSHRA